MAENAIIVGVGPNLSASLARLFAKEGMQIALAARNIDKLKTLQQETGARAYPCDASKPADVAKLFESAERDLGPPNVVVYNASGRARGPITEIRPEDVERALAVGAYGGFLVAREAATRMLEQGSGTILFTGASASVKGFANSSVFAMGKFALRGLAQALARELHPKNIHVGHIVIDGGISADNGANRPGAPDRGPDAWLHPDEIAKAYLALHRQHRTVWAWETEIRPWVEKF
jgi:NAD(P)-dependent dehydrogenase (short-subunit alcohol dehydrogenase family)